MVLVVLKEIVVEVDVIRTVSRIRVHAAAEGIIPVAQTERVTELVAVEPAALRLGSVAHHGIRWLPVIGGVVYHDLRPAPPGVIGPAVAAVLDSFSLRGLRASRVTDVAVVLDIEVLDDDILV